MPASFDPLRRPPIGFAHRGARAHAPDNTIEAFTLAARLGATGLESDAWITADRVVVLDHDGSVRRGLRRRTMAELDRDELPGHIPTLTDLYAAVGARLELSLDVKDPAAAEEVVAVARSRGDAALGRLWLCHPDPETVASWRRLSSEVHLVNSTSTRSIPEGLERRVAALAAAGVDAINLHRTEWTGGHVALVHRFERLALAWDVQHPHHLRECLRMGMDAVYSDHVDRMTTALEELAADGT